MNDEFFTEALRNDRVLKAERLVDQFKTELKAEIERWGEELVRENPHLFAEDPSSKISVNLSNGTIIANARDNLNLHKKNEDAPEKTQTLNISLRWVDPRDWDEQGVDGALCAACYKINRGNGNDFEQVRRESQEGDWNIRFADDQFNNAPGIIYIPVETASDFRAATAELQEHFTEFGAHYGVESETLEDD